MFLSLKRLKVMYFNLRINFRLKYVLLREIKLTMKYIK